MKITQDMDMGTAIAIIAADLFETFQKSNIEITPSLCGVIAKMAWKASHYELNKDEYA